MDFGKIIQKERNKRRWSTRKLSLMSDVTHSTISRIEIGQNEPTLLTAVRLMKALELTPTATFPEMQLAEPTQSEHELVAADLRQLWQNKEAAYRWLANTLNEIYGLLGENPQFTSDTVRLLITDEFPIQHISIAYPPRLTAEQIRQGFLDGGVIIPHDVKAFIERLPERIEMTSLERLRLDTVIETVRDAHSSLTDSLFSMFWSAYSYQDEVWKDKPHPPELERRLIEDCVIAYRWLQALGDPIPTLNSLRTTLNKSG